MIKITFPYSVSPQCYIVYIHNLAERAINPIHYLYVTVFGKTNRLARKTNFFFIALLPFTSSEDAAIQI